MECEAKKTFQEQLTSLEKTGQPVPMIRLTGDITLRNLVVKRVETDYIVLENSATDGTMIVPSNQIVSLGTF
ncbi:hypothetical protein [Lederbergia galactosidilytica]|uniref:LSM domain-containing protein n=1 Tax=Lederbergia galactosidilytica TaxID=217031 RepID=A0A0Q9Y7V5_9BACI|nr:hypothetical protein [Lederbergia galactosidilytica]KRG13857.1 hypothetical protein ACA30_12990 [Virgibacillus soli]KRG16959.1 hypothetical protein ACA29_01915 [Lederbergia galactosidilytica]OAK74352.1 hypothetical protein ABB05_04350 [Lederbergia galactosidilytica]